MADLFENPLGTDGFEFVQYASPRPHELHDLFTRLGFQPVGKHSEFPLTLYKQGDIHFIVNETPHGFAKDFSDKHGGSACAMAFRVKDAKRAYEDALKRGAKAGQAEDWAQKSGYYCLEGIGGSLLYLTDKYQNNSVYNDFIMDKNAPVQPAGLTYLDHLTHNVFIGNMDVWSGFYEQVFNFRQIRYFDIEGKLTGLVSRAMTSPCGKIRIPINESSDDKSQIAEYLKDYNGEGIQHIALGTNDIAQTVRDLRKNGIQFQSTPDTYYEKIDTRLPGHGENITTLKELRILVDGAPTEGQGLLLQIFTKTVIGPIFFEIIQRKGNEGFGEGNFQALFESIEEDQIRRGVLS